MKDYEEEELAEALERYTNPNDPEYDPEFHQQILKLRPDWLNKEIILNDEQQQAIYENLLNSLNLMKIDYMSGLIISLNLLTHFSERMLGPEEFEEFINNLKSLTKITEFQEGNT